MKEMKYKPSKYDGEVFVRIRCKRSTRQIRKEWEKGRNKVHSIPPSLCVQRFNRIKKETTVWRFLNVCILSGISFPFVDTVQCTLYLFHFTSLVSHSRIWRFSHDINSAFYIRIKCAQTQSTFRTETNKIRVVRLVFVYTCYFLVYAL